MVISASGSAREGVSRVGEPTVEETEPSNLERVDIGKRKHDVQEDQPAAIGAALSDWLGRASSYSRKRPGRLDGKVTGPSGPQPRVGRPGSPVRVHGRPQVRLRLPIRAPTD